MKHPGNLTSPRTTVGSRFSERLTCPWWSWGPAVVLVSVLAFEIGLGAGGLRTWLPPAVLLPLTLAGLWFLGRIRITVTEEELIVDDARLPLRFIADAIPLIPEDKRLLLGQAADPLAFVIQRPWIGGAVQVILNDPADPTPYWLITSRHPEKLAEALVAGRQLQAAVAQP